MQRIHLEQAGLGRSVVARFGALLLVTAGTEGLLARPGQADHADFRTRPSHFEGTNQLVKSARTKRVVPLGSVDRDPGEAVVDLVGDVGELGHRLPLFVESPGHHPPERYGLTILPNGSGLAKHPADAGPSHVGAKSERICARSQIDRCRSSSSATRAARPAAMVSVGVCASRSPRCRAIFTEVANMSPDT